MFNQLVKTLMLLLVPLSLHATESTRLLVGFSAGGTTDLVARVVAKHLAEVSDQNVQVVNKTGASGTMAAREIALSAPDTRDLMLITVTTHAIAPVVIPDIPYSVADDFRYITRLGQVDLVLVVHSDSPVQSVDDFVTQSRQRIIRYGSSGVGSTEHLAGQMFATAAQGQFTHIPYRGGAPMLIDLLGGRIDATFGWYTSLKKHIDSGRLTPLAVLSDTRLPGLPDVPTMKELGHDVEVTAWLGIAANAHMADQDLQRLHARIARILASPAFLADSASLGVRFDPVPLSPMRFREFVLKEHKRYRSMQVDQ
jgi:tripartite-type tricarboxylate transporter receptor subunit TctC